MTLEITTKKRAELRAQAVRLQSIFQIGKSGITEELVKGISDALDARELVKCSVLETAPLDARDACAALCEELGAAPVQVIGRKFTLYRPSPEKKDGARRDGRKRC